jgi:hypothetical protein
MEDDMEDDMGEDGYSYGDEEQPSPNNMEGMGGEMGGDMAGMEMNPYNDNEEDDEDESP